MSERTTLHRKGDRAVTDPVERDAILDVYRSAIGLT